MANLSQNKKYHYLYKTTNLVNGKYYYGMHSTNNLKDGYIGSGKYLWYAIKKYGKDNFHTEILKFFDTRHSLVEAEKLLITEFLVEDRKCMNLKSGGEGGFSRQDSDKARLSANKARIDMLKSDTDFRERWRSAIAEGLKRHYENGGVAWNKGKPGTWVGKKHKPESIEKMKQAAEGKSKGKDNSQYGTKWITNERDNKKIRSTDQIPEGWRAGRVIKNGSIV